MLLWMRISFVIGLILGGFTRDVLATEAPDEVEFFEKRIRPLLVEHCQSCHGPRKQESGLRLDSRQGLLKGTDSGPIVEPGKFEGSRLLQVLNHSPNDVQMPPEKKLADSQIADIRQWIERGAAWPQESGGTPSLAEAARQHWAFQPIHRPNPEPAAGMASPLDSLLAGSLKSAGLSFSPAADSYTFMRRITLDLWGIPPTADEVQEFATDTSPDARERLMDRLLASPRYGQRWARHWLDVARYADSKGYVFTAEPRYPYSYTYRDYVVDAFNSDRPFDEFVTEQLAADAIVADTDPRLTALGFLTVGRRYLNNNHDIIDDRIDVVGRGLLGLTVGCARCHDHKFDPIPTADYYSLFGIFASSVEPEDLPIIGTPKEAAAFEEFQKELTKRERALTEYEASQLNKVMDELRTRAGDCLILVARDNQNWLKLPSISAVNEPRRPLVDRWRRYLEQSAKGDHRVFSPWNELARCTPDDFAARCQDLVGRWQNDAEAAGRVNALVRDAIREAGPKSLPDLGKIYGAVFQRVVDQWTVQRQSAPDSTALADAAAEEIRAVLYAEGSPCVVSLEESRRLVGRDVRDHVTKLKRDIDNLKVTSAGAPPRAMVMRDGNLQDSPILLRGNPGRPGKVVPRQFLEVVAGPERQPFRQGSGRLELARAIVDRSNPLTARVIANRIWQHHFGVGIVPTPSDFGLRGLPPSHPQLLDWLAASLRDEGWSLKRLQRRILSSTVYAQAAKENPEARRVDPENRLLWRMPRLRIDLETMRDSMLAASGVLDPSLGGRPFDDLMNPRNRRRTIYAMVNRNDLPGVFRAFDFADVDASAPERPTTTVPQQALFALNSPFVIEMARLIAADCQTAAADEAGRVAQAYRRILSREPDSEEREIALNYLRAAQSSPQDKLSPLERLTQALLLTNDFWFVD